MGKYDFKPPERLMSCECCKDLAFEDRGAHPMAVRYWGKWYVGGVNQLMKHRPFPFATNSAFWHRYRKGHCLQKACADIYREAHDKKGFTSGLVSLKQPKATGLISRWLSMKFPGPTQRYMDGKCYFRT